jgi:hypothetical protein
MPVALTLPTPDTVIGKYNNAANQDIFQVVGPGGDMLARMDYKGVVSPTLTPVLQNAIQAINTNQPKIVSNIAPLTSLYNIALWMESRHDGGSGDTLTASITYSAPDGDVETVNLIIHGNVHEIQEENYVFLVVANTPIVFATTFTGSPFHYDVAAAISILPTVGV